MYAILLRPGLTLLLGVRWEEGRVGVMGGLGAGLLDILRTTSTHLVALHPSSFFLRQLDRYDDILPFSFFLIPEELSTSFFSLVHITHVSLRIYMFGEKKNKAMAKKWQKVITSEAYPSSSEQSRVTYCHDYWVQQFPELQKKGEPHEK